MLPKSFTLAAAGLAATTNAFLLPPEVAEADAPTVSILPFDVPLIAEARTLELSCPGCSLKLKGEDGELSVQYQGATHLELAFAVEPGAESDRLTVNGFELYPNADPFTSTLRAPHLADAPIEDESTTNPATPELGFGLRSHAEAHDEESHMDLVSLDLQIIEVGTTFVDGIPNVNIKLIKAPGGALMIGGVETTGSQTLQPSTPMDKQEECTGILCKWTAVVEEELAQLKKPFKNCHGGKKAHGQGEAGHKGSLHHHGDHKGHHMHAHGYHRSWAKLFKRIASHILLPVLVGIIAGVFVSFLGMLVGTIIVALWRKFARGSSRRHHRHASHHHHKAASREPAVPEEKSGLMADQEAPPAYDDAESKADNA